MSDTETREIGFGHPDNYEMFTDEGNRAVAAMVNELLRDLALMEKDHATLTDKGVYRRLEAGMKKIGLEHEEVYDTAVRECIIGRVERKLARDLSIYF